MVSDESGDAQATPDAPSEQAQANPAPANAPRDSVGSRLRAAREAQGQSIESVAGLLKVAPRRIEALEADQWSELPQGPYLRGFLRSYAQVVKADADALMTLLASEFGSTREQASINLTPSLTTPFPERSSGSHDRRHTARMVRWTLLVALLGIAIWWSGTESFHKLEQLVSSLTSDGQATNAQNSPVVRVIPVDSAESGNAVSPAPAPVGAPAGGATTPLALAPGVQTGGTMAPRGEANPSAALPAVSMAPAPTDASGAASARERTVRADLLRLRFNGESWVEVREADGHIVWSQLSHAGVDQSLDGKAPFDVVVGNAPVVTLTWRGNEIDLAPFTSRERVAHVVLK